MSETSDSATQQESANGPGRAADTSEGWQWIVELGCQWIASLRDRLRNTGIDISSLDLDQDTAHDLLSNSRRRHVISYLTQPTTKNVTIGELTAYVACEEHNSKPEDVTSQERKAVYVGLYQCHLPALDEAGVIDFQHDDVLATDQTEALDALRKETGQHLRGDGQ